MSGYNLARKAKRTKREQAMLMENMNRNAIEQLMNQQANMGETLNMAAVQMIEFQKEILALKNCLKRKGVITDFEVSQERSAIEELEQMKSKAIILGENK